MEDRRPIHYHRNTLRVPKLGTKSRHKLRKKPLDIAMPEAKVPQDISPKICSTLECPRCDAVQRYYRATCYRCRACFYCGLVGGSAFQCHLCGNHIPPEDRETRTPETIRIA
jgi:hypothetical protein